MQSMKLFPDLTDDNEINVINIDPQAELTDEDVSIILINILRRAIQDASGENLIDHLLTHQEKNHAREYLMVGYIKKYGHYYYDDSNIKYTPKRNHESMAEKFQPTEKAQYSPIPLNHILDYFDIEHEAFFMYIDNWKDDNWSRTNSWYQNFLEETNVI